MARVAEDIHRHLELALNGEWHPRAEANEPGDLSGHLRVGNVWMYLGMGTADSDGEWLQVAYLYARPSRDAPDSDTSACGTGLGTRVIEALRSFTDETGIPLRFVSIENTAFFRRFDGWSDDRLDDTDEPDGECWYYPAR